QFAQVAARSRAARGYSAWPMPVAPTRHRPARTGVNFTTFLLFDCCGSRCDEAEGGSLPRRMGRSIRAGLPSIADAIAPVEPDGAPSLAIGPGCLRATGPARGWYRTRSNVAACGRMRQRQDRSGAKIAQ